MLALKAYVSRRLGKIIYFCESGRKKGLFCHVRWFEHGARTVLAETADPQELFLLDSCDTISVSAILQKVGLKELENNEKVSGLPNVDPTATSFYQRCISVILTALMDMRYILRARFKWKDDLFTFVHPSFDNEDALMDALSIERHQRCYPCAAKYRDDLE